jgi:2-dehydropantoate 2-reductase
MRIAVFGTGAVGAYFGGRLAEAGEDVVFIARGDHLRAIREDGLRVDSVAGDFRIHPAKATDDPTQVGPVDCVLVGTKTWQLDEAARAMGPLVGPQTFLVPLLNGVEAPEVLARELGEDHVLGGLCGGILFRDAPGRIRHTGAEPWVTFGELDAKPSDRAGRLGQAFERARGVRVSVAPDIRAAMWEKFLFIASTGGVGSATRSPFGVFREVPETRQLLEAAMEEVAAVARTHGIDLPEDAIDRALQLTDGLPPEATSSMHRDFMAGRRTELDAWNGGVVRFGRRAGVPTPVHEALYGVLLPQELRARGDVSFPQASGVDP